MSVEWITRMYGNCIYHKCMFVALITNAYMCGVDNECISVVYIIIEWAWYRYRMYEGGIDDECMGVV